MPVMDGFQFLYEFRQKFTKLDIPIVVLTSKTLSTDERELLSGLRNVIQKGSMSQEQLVKQIGIELAKCRTK